MEETAKPDFDQWCLVELMGHQRIAGRVTQESLFGSALMRVDVPDEQDGVHFTRYFGGSAIYAITPVTKEVATALARNIQCRPVTVYDIQQRPQIGSASAVHDDNEDETWQ